MKSNRDNFIFYLTQIVPVIVALVISLFINTIFDILFLNSTLRNIQKSYLLITSISYK